VTIATDVGVHDVEAGPAVQLGVLEALGGVELAMRPAGVIQDLGEHPDDVVVVVKDLVVVAAGPRVTFGKDGARSVDHDLPHVRVGEERVQGAISGQVPQRPFDGAVRVGDVDDAPASAVVVPP
jgi:hypothetical protein